MGDDKKRQHQNTNDTLWPLRPKTVSSYWVGRKTCIHIYIYHFYIHICHFLPISVEQLDEKTFQTYKIGRERKRRQKEMWVVLCIVVIVEATCIWVIDKNKKNKKYAYQRFLWLYLYKRQQTNRYTQILRTSSIRGLTLDASRFSITLFSP